MVGRMGKMCEYRLPRKVLTADESGGQIWGRPRLGSMDGVKMTLGRQHRDDSGSYVTMREKYRVESPWCVCR